MKELPKIDLPIYELRIPSTGQDIRVRPFLVKEEKLLLMAAESEDEQEIVNVTKQVINNCLIDNDVNVDNLPFFDVDYLFIALRAKSIGETVEMRFTCNNVMDDGETCGNAFYADIDISNATIIADPDITKDIILSDKISLKMKYPSYSIMKFIEDSDNAIDKKIKIMINCIEYIFDGENVYTSKDYSKDQMKDFIENLTENQFKKIENFIDNFPTFAVMLNAECGKCGYVHHLQYKDFSSFFH